MASSQNRWSDYIAMFPLGHQVVIQSLKITYEDEFEINEFSGFEQRLTSANGILFEELSQIPVDTQFIISLSQWLKKKASGLSEWGAFLDQFEEYEREWASSIRDYYTKNQKISIGEFRNFPDKAVASDIVFSLPSYDSDFWQEYIIILINRYNALINQLSITRQPQSVGGCPGKMVTFSIETNTEEVSYQWKKNGKNITGATKQSYSFELSAGDNHAEITVLISKGSTTVLSKPAIVSVEIPEILEQPRDVSAQIGSDTTFSLKARGEDVTYQWRKNSIPLKGMTEPVLSLKNIQLSDSGQYDCVVSTSCQSIISQRATLQVLDNYLVKGKIIKADHSPAVDYTVKAYHSDNGAKYLLGEKQTDSNGNYKIAFTAEQFGLEWKGKANLIVVVTSQGVNQRSPLILGARKIQVVNMITAKKSITSINEYSKLKEWFEAHSPEFIWTGVTQQDVDTFTKRSQFPKAWVKAYSQANSITSSSKAIQGYYGLIRTKAGFNPQDFLNLKPQEIEKALRVAKNRNFIYSFFDEASFIANLSTVYKNEVGNLIQSEDDNDVKRFVDLVDFKDAPTSTKNRFFELYRENRDSAENFWDAVDKDRDLKAYSQSLKLVSQMGAVTSSNIKLMSELKSAHTFKGAQDLVQLTGDDLENDIQNAGNPIPSYIEGDTPAEKRKNYAQWISGQIEEAFPTPYMAARISENSTFPSQEDFGTFFSNNKEFQLGKEPIHQYLSANKDALSGIPNPDVFTKDLLKLQRFHTIAPRDQKAKTATALFNKNYESAPQIATTSFTGFVADLSKDIGKHTASQVYGSAREVTARSVNLAGKYNQGLNAVEFGVVRGNKFNTYSPELKNIFPDIETLLGETDYCACEHCKSIFGPAAYLVDLLQYCQTIETGDLSLYEMLTQTYDGLNKPRRGDMPQIDLSCDNTTIQLPAIDIVNELLCNLVDSAYPEARQTTWTAEELRIAPEYPPTDAINAILSSNKFPWGLPFDYFSRSIILQLPIVGTSRGEIAWNLPQAGGDTSSGEGLQNIRTLGSLCISKTTWLRLKLYQFNLNTTYNVTGNDVPDYFEDNAGKLLVKKLIDHTGISFERFQGLLKTAALNPYQSDGSRKYSITYVKSGCSLEDARLSGIEDFYNRFYYLEKATSSLGWPLSITDLFVRGYSLQEAIDDPDSTVLDSALDSVALIKKLAQKLDTRFSPVLSWFTMLNTVVYDEDERTQFETIYLNPEVGYTYSGMEKDGLELNNERTGLNTPKTLEEMKNAVLSSLQISEKALDSLVTSGWLGGETYSIEVTLARLSRLYGYAELVSALDLEMSAFITLWKGFTENPGIPLDTSYETIENLINFVDFVQQLKTSAFTREELNSLFNTIDLEKILPVAEVTGWLKQLRKTLNGQWQQTIDNLENTQQGITFLLKTQTIETVEDVDYKNIDIIINGEFTSSVEDELVDWWDDAFSLVNAITIDKIDFQKKVIDTSLASYFKDRKDRIVYIYEKFLEADQTDASKPSLIETVFTHYLNQFALQEFISHFLEGFPDVSPLQDTLLTTPGYLQAIGDSGAPILNMFTAKSGFVENGNAIKPVNFPRLYSAYRLIFKNLLFLSKFKHIDQYYPLFYDERPEDWPKAASFPVTDVPGPAMSGLQKVWELHAVEKALSLEKSELFMMLLQAHEGGLANEEDVQQRLSTLTGWPLSEIQHLTGSSGFNFTGDYYLQSDWIYRLYRAFEVAGKLAVKPSVVQVWNKMLYSKADASAVQQAVRKHLKGETDTDKLIKVNDRLREALRDALVGYVVYKTDVLNGVFFEKSKAGMSDFLLTDIEKSACGMTSRIKQALSAIQMLMQRALLGLERLQGSPASFEVPSGPAKEWVWRKNYRVWEANRKVFMYPENWLLEETRDDQTQLYQNFVEELSQSNVTDESARRAVTHYLRGLNEIADLEIAQIYQEEYEDDDANKKHLTGTVHIFARTKSEPHKYYYRKWVDDAYFTPWEELPLEIEGDHLIPAKYSGRFWLFWPIFIEKGKEEENVTTDVNQNGNSYSASSPGANKYYEIRIAWTTAFRGEWQPKKISKETFSTESSNDDKYRDKSKYYFYTDINSKGDLILTPIFYNGESDTPQTLTYFMRFSGSQSQPELLSEAEIPNTYLLPGGKPHYMQNEFVENNPIPRFSAGPSPDDPAVNRLITSVTTSKATVPQQFPYEKIRSDYAFTFEDRRHNFLANPEASTSFLKGVSRSTVGAIGATVSRGMRKTKNPNLKQNAENPLFSRDLGPTEDGGLPSGTSSSPKTDGLVFGSDDSGATFHTYDGGDENGGGPPYHVKDPILTEPDEGSDPEDSMTPLLPTHRFYANYHPFASDFYREVNRYGLQGLYQPIQQNLKRQLAQTDFDFKAVYDPSSGVIPKYPIEDIDFSSFGAYSVYNWELFLHIPMSVAQMLTSNYRFAEAQEWLHHIFDPTESEGKTPERFWKMKPLYKFSGLDTEQELIDFMNGSDENLQKLVKLWEKDPFNPHLIARFRISTYMRRVIMIYVENLLAWGDQLFTEDSIESINEAFQLYMLAWRILGERPKKLPPQEHSVKSIEELIDPGPSNVLVYFSDVVTTNLINTSVNYISPIWQQPAQQLAPMPVLNTTISQSSVFPSLQISSKADLREASPGQSFYTPVKSALPSGSSRFFAQRAAQLKQYNPAADQFSQAAEAMNTLGYFCVLPNTQMYDYWDTVEDRLNKIRNCLNIAGEERSLSLFEPPIDPGAIIAALANGESLGSAISGITAPLPYYRFRYLLGHAFELVQEVKGLGQSLLSALEKADAKELSLLRAQHQENVLEAVRQVKIKAVEEAQQSLQALQSQRESVTYREQFYRNRKYTIVQEENYVKGMQTANTLTTTAAGINLVSGALNSIPEFSTGVNGPFGSPHAAVKIGGYVFAATTSAAARVLQSKASISRNKAGIENTKGGWKRRQANWTFQAESAKKELSRIDQLIAAGKVRIEMAKRDLAAHDRQISNAVETEQVIDTQFTHRDLYMWMRSELSTLYRKAYNDALTLAKQAEQCFHFELWDANGKSTVSYITSNHWDGLKKGLLSGEKLERQLRNMQKSYDDQNERLFELKKHVPLSELDPGALLRLKRTGKTTFSIPEFLFDLDYAGQYQRRIKSVAVTIPCVSGPYGNVTARLSMTSNLVREKASMENGYDSNFIEGISPSQAIATTIGTSSANQDSGLFQLNFNDERYLPFEGAGVKSDWVLELPNVHKPSEDEPNELILKQFDYDSISDVILHIDYTSRENTGTFKDAVKTYLRENLNSGIEGGWNELISMKSQFSDAFYKFLHPAEEQQDMEAEFVLTNKQFPYIFNGLETKITEMIVFIQPKEDYIDEFSTDQVKVKLGKAGSLPNKKAMTYGTSDEDETYQLLYADFDYSPPIQGSEKNISMIKTDDKSIPVVTSEKVEDILLLVSFEKV